MQKIGIITVSYNSNLVLTDFLDSILSQSYKNWILYIIDNASQDNTIGLINKYNHEQIRVMPQNENLGFAKATNLGIQTAIKEKCELIWLINNDTIFEKSVLLSLVKKLDEKSSDMISPKILYYNSNKLWYAGGGFTKGLLPTSTHYGNHELDMGQYDVEKFVNFAPMCCLLIKSVLFNKEKVGILDHKYFLYYEDTDWMFKAIQQKALLLYTPEVIIEHKVSSLTKGILSNFTLQMLISNRIYFLRKNFSTPLKYLYIISLISYLIAKIILGRFNLGQIKTVVIAVKNGIKL